MLPFPSLAEPGNPQGHPYPGGAGGGVDNGGSRRLTGPGDECLTAPSARHG